MVRCNECNVSFASVSNLQMHKKAQHGRKTVKCPKCARLFSTMLRFREHWNRQHVAVAAAAAAAAAAPDDGSTHEISESESSQDSDTSAVDNEPASTATTERPAPLPPSTMIRCRVCSRVSESQKEAVLHYRQEHAADAIQCSVCRKRVRKLAHTRHMNFHRKRGHISADDFNRLIKVAKAGKHASKVAAAAAAAAKVPAGPSTCPVCSATFSSHRCMKIHHALKHLRPKAVKPIKPAVPSTCPVCSATFSNHRCMQMHYKWKHLRPKAVKPPTTRRAGRPAATITAPTTVTPIRSVSELRSRPPTVAIVSDRCPVCKKAFRTPAATRKHYETVHLQTTVSKCPLCFTKYSSTGNVRIHFATAHPNFAMPAELRARPKVKRKLRGDSNASSENSDTAAKKPETNDAAAGPEQAKAPVDAKSVSSPLLRMFDNIRAKNALTPPKPLVKPPVQLNFDVIEVVDLDSRSSARSPSPPAFFSLNDKHCTECDESHGTRFAAASHYMRRHPNEMQQCPKCQMLISSARSMMYHWKTKHPRDKLPYYLHTSYSIVPELFKQFARKKCTLCACGFANMSASLAHFKRVHDVSFFVCTECSEGCRTQTIYNRHMFTEHGIKECTAEEVAASASADSDGMADDGSVDDGSADDASEQTAASAAADEDDGHEESMAEDGCLDESDAQSTTPSEATTIDVAAADASPMARDQSPAMQQTEIGTVFYPFIVSQSCPICSKEYATRHLTLKHYKRRHCTGHIQCRRCITEYATVEHMKQHWAAAHEAVAWEDYVVQNEQEENDGAGNFTFRSPSTPDRRQMFVKLKPIEMNLDLMAQMTNKQLLDEKPIICKIECVKGDGWQEQPLDLSFEPNDKD